MSHDLILLVTSASSEPRPSRRRQEGIGEADACSGKVGGVAGHDGQVVDQGDRCDLLVERVFAVRRPQVTPHLRGVDIEGGGRRRTESRET